MRIRPGNKYTQQTGIFASFLVVSFAVAMLIAPVFKSSADELDVGVNVSSVISLSMSSDSVMIDAPVGGGFGSDSTNAIVLTNSAFGYTLAIEDADNDTSLTSATSTDTVTSNYMASKTSETLENNTWGFSVDNTKFYAIPLNGSPLQLAKSSAPTSDEGVITEITFGAKTSSSLTSGVYTDSIVISAYVNGVDGSPDVIIDEVSDDTPEPYDDGEGSNENKLVLLTSMQDSKLQQYCSETYKPTANAKTTIFDRYFNGDLVPRAVVKDKRDGTKYLITKLADNKCWMSTNLALDLVAGETLTNKLTDLTTMSEFTPQNSTETSLGTVWASPSTVARSYKFPDSQKYFRNGVTASTSPTADTSAYIWERSGNVYNWYAATAGEAINANVSNRIEVKNSICPKGWTLPSVDWIYYFNDANGVYRNKISNFHADPMNFVKPGYHNYGSTGAIIDSGRNGSYWTRRGDSTASALYLDQNSSVGHGGTPPGYGLSVRCVAR